MKKIILGLILLVANTILINAQYFGGNGGGDAMATL